MNIRFAAILPEKFRTKPPASAWWGSAMSGLPLAVEYAEAGFHVTGIDLSEAKVARVNAGDSYIGDIPSSVLAPLVQAGTSAGHHRFLV